MKSNQHATHASRITVGSLLVALGIIYGDIGTSPLYVLKAIVGEKPVEEGLVLGGISCIFWTLTLQTTLKYILLTLRADNQGEGGIFSLYALVKRHGKWLALPAIVGATTLLADGIITPPISVASAVEGLTAVPGLEHLPTVPIVVAILSLLFFFQRYGTQRVGVAFGPIMVVWFGMLFVLGLYQVVQHPAVLRALNPAYAYDLLVAYPGGFWLLGAVFLATTGAEALYSDLGHCGRRNIQLTWIAVKTCLVMNYMGQAAWLLRAGGHSLDGRNPFYALMPGWFLLPGVIIATLATIIASQALISGSYTLVGEAANLNFWPRVAVRQPTEKKGQIYIPSVNVILWAGCVLMILYFQSSTHMEAAYGFSITIAMLMTTLMLAYYLRYRLRWPLLLVVGLFLLFTTVEGSFLVANIAKIKERWMFLFFELGIFLVMYIWYRARRINMRYTRWADLGAHAHHLSLLSRDTAIPKAATHLVYLTKSAKREEVEERIIHSIMATNPKRADVYWFLHIQRTEEPYTLDYEVSQLVEGCVYKVSIQVGFRIQPKTERYFKQIVQEMEERGELQPRGEHGWGSAYNPEPHIKFVVFRKFLSIENDLDLGRSLLLNGYLLIKRLAQSEQRAFGLEKSDTAIEQVPLTYPAKPMEVPLRRLG